MSYWLVPLLQEKMSSLTRHTSPEDIIDWAQVRETCEKEEYRWTPSMSHSSLANKFIVDPNDGGRRFYSVKVAPQFKPTDPVPDLAPKYKYMRDILDYSISLWAKSRAKWEDSWDRSQPVIEVEKIPFRRNLLASIENDEAEAKFNKTAFVCPQPLKISAVSIFSTFKL
jgi:endoribonuclease Dicer